MSTPDALPVAIVGGGLTGLAAAWRLVKTGRRVRLFEATGRIGGVVQSERHDGWLVESGPNSLQETPELAPLLDELGLEPAKCYAAPAAKQRYIVRDGEPRTVPMSPPAFITSNLFSTRTKLRMLAEVFRRPAERSSDVSLASFAREHFGNEFLDYALNPIVSGVYAGDPESLSARHAFPWLWDMERRHGSILRAAIARAGASRRASGKPSRAPRILSFREGLAQLPQALAASLPPGSIETDAEVTQLHPGSPWRLEWQRDGRQQAEACAAVLLALPAGGLSRLRIAAGDDPFPLKPLEDIAQPPVSSLFLGYTRQQVGHPLDGFGMLVPAREKRSVLGVLFSSTLFPGRAPDGHVALTVLTGGALRPELATLADDELMPLVKSDLAGLLKVAGDPVFVQRRIWPRAIPQYNLGYERHLETMKRAEAIFPGLHIGGNARDGIAMGACLASGLRLAGCVSDGPFN